jgi:hypothetical protein
LACYIIKTRAIRSGSAQIFYITFDIIELNVMGPNGQRPGPEGEAGPAPLQLDKGPFKVDKKYLYDTNFLGAVIDLS